MTSKNISNIFLAALVVLGFSAMMSQIIIIRELIFLFTGNELTIGIIMSVWLLWTAIGSGYFGRLTQYVKKSINLFSYLFFFIGILLPITIVSIKLSREFLSIMPGEIFHPFLIFIIPFFSLAPIASLFGFLFTLSCHILDNKNETKSHVPGKVYFFEAIGAGGAGFIASIFLFRFLDNFQITLIITGICFICGLMLLFISDRNKFKILTPIFLVLFSFVIFISPQVKKMVKNKIWGTIEFVESKTTIYGNITVTKIGETVSFYENGMLMFSYPDLLYAEESVHFALLEHPAPKKVLLIGGDPVGSLNQVLSYTSIEKIDFLLLDPALIEMTQKYIPASDHIFNNSKVQFIYQDGRQYLDRTTNKYDVIMINLPAPETTQINRFYTTEFYQSAKSSLTWNGVMGFSISASENVIGAEKAELLSCLFYTFKQAFQEIVVIPGNTVHFIGSKTKGNLTNDPDILSDRIKQRKLSTKYIQDYFLSYRLSPDRIKYIYEIIDPGNSTKLNYDFHPISYFYNNYLWLTNFNKKMIGSIHGFVKLSKPILSFVIFAIVLSFLIYFFRSKNRDKQYIRTIILSIILIGCTTISMEILIIHGFQVIYGYAYYQLSLIITGFMIGLACGSWYSIRLLQRNKATHKWYFTFQSFITLYPLITYLFLILLSKITVASFIIQVLFFGLISGLGFIGGFQFPLANFLIFRQNSQIAIVGGKLYAWDLFGSVIGAMLISTFLIPVFGILTAILCFFVLNLVVLMLLLLKH
jgi:spermidine synthase